MPNTAKLMQDATNLAILRELSAEPRIGPTELARKIGMSAPAVRERVQRLEESGVILAYQTLIDPRALGYTVTVFVRVRPMPGCLSKVIDVATTTENVVECHRVTGEDCFIVKAHLRSIDDLDELLDRFLAFGQTTTSIAQSTPVPLRPLPLPS